MMGKDEAGQRQAAQVKDARYQYLQPSRTSKQEGASAMTACVPIKHKQGKLRLGRKVSWDLFVSKAFLPLLLHVAWGQWGSQSLRYHVLK